MEQKVIVVKILGLSGLEKAESKYRKKNAIEAVPFAKNTSYKEIAHTILPDKDGIKENGLYSNPLYICKSKHVTTIGSTRLCNKTLEYLNSLKEEYPMDILSVSVCMETQELSVTFLIRLYTPDVPKFSDIYSYFKETNKTKSIDILHPSEEGQDPEHFVVQDEKIIESQKEALLLATKEAPVLNTIKHYHPLTIAAHKESLPIYNLIEIDKKTSTILHYDEFVSIFQETMRYITSVEKDSYYNVLSGDAKEKDFMDVVETYVKRVFIHERQDLPIEDVPALLKKVYRALFELYIIQDLIDDPEISDIKITDPYSVRVRIRGKAYLSNISFIDADDYIRFVNGIYIKNNIDYRYPTQTFVDNSDENYILRFTITAPYMTPSNYPIIHIRKKPRVKRMGPDLIAAGMFDENIMHYLIDCGKYSRGVVFAGPPGCGKTDCLNWFLEDAYENTAEILVIQETDELFSYKKGIMFEHVVNNPTNRMHRCTLEDLGQTALVAGANVFVIGEAKGGEICSAITLSNSGCRTAMTIHSPSATETIDKMADLAMRGYATNYEQAKRMIKSFQTIVFLNNYKVEEITEIIGYDEEKKDMIYRYIYRRE